MAENARRETTASATRTGISLPWVLAIIAMIAVIWGNSMVPGEGSGNLSAAVLAFLQGGLDALGIPSAWLTEFIVRKTAHFTEYMVLGLIAMQAYRPHRAPHMGTVLATALTLVLVPSLDETIQRFVNGRSGQVSDVLLDCCGAAFGVVLTLAVARIRTRLRTRRDSDSHGAA